jgi:acyl carrier protein
MTTETSNGQGDGVADRVRQFIVENFFVSDTSRLANDESLITGGFVDSTGLLEVIAFLEGEYGMRIDEREMVPDNLETIDRIVAFVARKRQGAAGRGA